MTQPIPQRTDFLRRDVEASWHRFLDLYEPLRPELYRYCRHLTRSPWDADDLVQDALFRAFAKLGCMNEPPVNPRAWLFRIASNLWIDRVRAQKPEPDPRRLSAIAADSLGCSGHRVAAVEQEQRADTAPRSGAHRRAAGQHLFQARAILRGELEPRKSRSRRHLKL